MARIDEVTPKYPLLDSLSYYKERQDMLRHEDNVKRQEDVFDFQKEQDKWVKEIEIKSQIQREIDRKSDRKFLWTVTLVSAIIGALIGSIATIIFELFFK